MTVLDFLVAVELVSLAAVVGLSAVLSLVAAAGLLADAVVAVGVFVFDLDLSHLALCW